MYELLSEPNRPPPHIKGMAHTLTLVGSFVAIFLPVLGLFILGLSHLASR